MNDTEKLEFLLKALKQYAEHKHCYERDPFYDVYDERDLGETVEQAEEYAQIHFARTLLEQIDETFEYPVMKNLDTSSTGTRPSPSGRVLSYNDLIHTET